MKSVLVLEDGTYFSGEAFGIKGETVGEVVFNTSMAGYQEIITTPSYNGQIVAFTYPLIGNYGFNNTDYESDKTHVRGLIVKELCDFPSNWKCTKDPQDFFEQNGIIGIKGIDTRALAQHIRDFGSMLGIISTECGNIDILLEKLKSKLQKNSENSDLVKEVTTKNPVHIPGTGKKVTILDFGVKNSIIASLQKRKCSIYLMPANSGLEDIISSEPDGILLSDGPGNPKDLPDIKNVIQKLIGKMPILGIGLGHQLLGLALGGDTYKLKFGHHGSNYAVKDYTTGRCYITLQSHNYALKANVSSDVEITHININDNTVEGFRHKNFPLISVQYYPDSSGDSAYIYDNFINMMNNFK